MRVLVLTPAFHRERRVYARPGSPVDALVRKVLRQLADERVPAPGPFDVEALRTPYQTIWARSVSDTELVVTFVVTPQTLDLLGVRPDWRPVR